MSDSKFDVTVFIFTRLRRPHVTDIYPFKYFRTLAGVFKFTRFVWAIYPVTCGRFTRLRVDGKRNRENIYPVLNLHGYVWTGPYFIFKNSTRCVDYDTACSVLYFQHPYCSNFKCIITILYELVTKIRLRRYVNN